MILGIPTFNQVNLTELLLLNLNSVTVGNEVKLAIIDNASDEPISSFPLEEFCNLDLRIIRNETNRGYFYPLKQLLEAYPKEELIGLCHNDITICTKGWDLMVLDSFSREQGLGLLGFCGSRHIGADGEINDGLMGNFVENQEVVGQFASFAQQVDNIAPAVCLDSMFMMFRREAAEKLILWNEVTPYHWFDRFWSMMVLDMGYKIAVRGVKISHQGGGTAGSKEYKKFIGKRGDELLYSKTKARFLDLYGKRLPIWVDGHWNYHTPNCDVPINML